MFLINNSLKLNESISIVQYYVLVEDYRKITIIVFDEIRFLSLLRSFQVVFSDKLKIIEKIEKDLLHTIYNRKMYNTIVVGAFLIEEIMIKNNKNTSL